MSKEWYRLLEYQKYISTTISVYQRYKFMKLKNIIYDISKLDWNAYCLQIKYFYVQCFLQLIVEIQNDTYMLCFLKEFLEKVSRSSFVKVSLKDSLFKG